MSETAIFKESPLFLADEEITRPDAVFRTSCRACGQKFDFEDIAAFTPFLCPSCQQPLVTPKVFGEYWLLGRLHSSSRYRIYQAHDPLLDRMVAIKVVRKDKFDHQENELRSTNLFYDAQLQTLLETDQAVEIYRACTLEERNFKVMELLTGGNLQFANNPEKRCDPILALSGVSSVAATLNKAAEMGFAHGNISPEHLIFNSEGVLKLLNFLSPETITGRFTECDYLYYAPERIVNYTVNAQSDIYSLGVVLFEFLARTHPMGNVANLSELELVARQNRNPIPPLKNHPPVNDDSLFALIHSMLEPVPGNRPGYMEVITVLNNAVKKLARKQNMKIAISRISKSLLSNFQTQ